MKMKCEICGIECNNLTRHHLIPQTKHNKRTKKKFNDLQKTINICSLCHTTIHSKFSANELRDSLNSKESLLQNEQMKTYLKWRIKHPYFSSDSTKLKRH